MEHRVFRFHFETGVHFGEGALEDSSIRLRADTVFSALCIEAIKMGEQQLLDRLVSLARDGSLLLSDAFPFVENELYITKPFFRIDSEQSDDGGATVNAKKAFKKLQYIPFNMVQDYFFGDFDVNLAQYTTERLNNGLGISVISQRAAVRLPDDTLPYNVGIFNFHKGAGLYIIACGAEESISLCRDLLTGVAKTGIGGKRTSGLGRFSIEEEPLDEDMLHGFHDEHIAYMTLSLSLPQDDELENVLRGASYALLRRGGFVFSETYSEEALRKNDLFALDSGSVVRSRFKGGVYDVSHHGSHPVYRYAKPMLLGVKL